MNFLIWFRCKFEQIMAPLGSGWGYQRRSNLNVGIDVRNLGISSQEQDYNFFEKKNKSENSNLFKLWPLRWGQGPRED